jgi:hypothetical protein
MADLIFPPPPLTIGQTFTAPNGVTYEWDGAVWGPATGITALWSDNKQSALMTPVPPDRSLSLAADSSVHFGDPTSGACPCIEAVGNDLTLEVPGTCLIEIGGTVVGSFTTAGFTGPVTNTKPNTALAFSVPIDVSPAIVLAATETFICEWSVPQQAGRPFWLSVFVGLTLQNVTGGIQNPTNTTLTLRSGGTAGQPDGAVVKALPPINVAVPQNAQVTASDGFGLLVTPTANATVRYSITGLAPTASKNTITARHVTGVVLGFA